MHIALLLLLSQFFFWSTPIDWQTYQGNVALWGTVVDQAGRAVPRAVVSAVSGSDVRQSTSDSNGHFVFLTLLPGTYRLCAWKNGYPQECSRRDSQPETLFAGFEYGATIVLTD